MEYLCSDSEEEQDVKITDEGSYSQYAEVFIQGVPAEGLIDSGAEFTIVDGDLFKKVATVNKSKKKDLKKPDKVPKTYSRQTFIHYGRMELDISFGEKLIRTSVFIKMDAYDQLLLSEGVCRQLGIINYHPNVRLCKQKQKADNKNEEKEKNSAYRDNDKDSKDDVVVPMVRVRLVQGVKLLPQQATRIQVQKQGDSGNAKTFLVEPDPHMADMGLSVEPTLLELKDGRAAQIVIKNSTGFTHRLDKGFDIGTLEEAEVVLTSVDTPKEDEKIDVWCDKTEKDTVVNAVTTVSERQHKVREMFQDNLSLPKLEKEKFCQFLLDHHTVFSLEDNERGETNLVQLEIDTGDAQPRRQHPRRLPYVAKQEVARQLQTMQEAGIIQPSISQWASPVVLVRKRWNVQVLCGLQGIKCSDQARYISTAQD